MNQRHGPYGNGRPTKGTRGTKHVRRYAAKAAAAYRIHHGNNWSCTALYKHNKVVVCLLKGDSI